MFVRYNHSELQASNFDIELDSFIERVPIFDNVTFTNIVARLNPNAKKFLALACHYDSKYFPGETFYAATDSAVPCSIILNVVKTLQSTLDQMKNREDVSLMVSQLLSNKENFKIHSKSNSFKILVNFL